MRCLHLEQRKGQEESLRGAGKQQWQDKHLRTSRLGAFVRQKLSRVMSKQLEHKTRRLTKMNGGTGWQAGPTAIPIPRLLRWHRSGQWDGSGTKGSCCQAWDLSSISRTHTVEGELWLPCILWRPQVYHGTHRLHPRPPYTDKCFF